MPLADHLARHRLADLFLDTLPCNAHTTTSDALWTGLPVLTCAGQTFASRVAASLLHAVGMPELVMNDYAEYESLAVRLGSNPMLLSVLKEKLNTELRTSILFDTNKFVENLEFLYEDLIIQNQAKVK
jgi:predicted O-linked N-acetylglucosamine transferase (SPINDLY family)